MIIRTIRWPIVGVVAAVSMLLAGGAIFWAMHASSLKYTHGPLAKKMGTNADSSSIGVLVGQTVVLGGAPVMEQFTRLARYHAAKDAPYEVVAVRPTNLSSGIHVVKEAGLLIPPGLGIGTLEWANKVLHHKMQNLPIVRNHGAVEPILMVQPTKPGRYIIKGLFIPISGREFDTPTMCLCNSWYVLPPLRHGYRRMEDVGRMFRCPPFGGGKKSSRPWRWGGHWTNR